MIDAATNSKWITTENKIRRAEFNFKYPLTEQEAFGVRYMGRSWMNKDGSFCSEMWFDAMDIEPNHLPRNDKTEI